MIDQTTDMNTRLCLGMSRSEAAELLTLLNRATNTLEPKYWPTWVDGVMKRLEAFSHAKTGGGGGGSAYFLGNASDSGTSIDGSGGAAS